MHRKTLVHIVDYPQANPWLEDQISYLMKNGIHQSIISIKHDDQLIKNLKKQNLTDILVCKYRIGDFFAIGRKLKKANSLSEIIIYAHGHKPAIMALFLKLVFNMDYVISHHHPPHWIDLFQVSHKFRGKYHQILRDCYYKNALAIQAFSTEVENYLRCKSGLDAVILNIPLGVKFTRFKKVDSERFMNRHSANKLKILTVSRLVWEKRVNIGLEFAYELSKLHSDFEYTIVGDGPLMPQLVELRNQFKLADRVHFRGWVANVDDYYRSHDILLHLSLTESYGQAIIEGRLHGLYVITSPCGVALDISKVGDDNLKVLTNVNPKEIANEVRTFSTFSRNKCSDKPSFEIYLSHEFYSAQERLRLALIELFEKVSS